jgi:hypothetical protein
MAPAAWPTARCRRISAPTAHSFRLGPGLRRIALVGKRVSHRDTGRLGAWCRLPHRHRFEHDGHAIPDCARRGQLSLQLMRTICTRWEGEGRKALPVSLGLSRLRTLDGGDAGGGPQQPAMNGCAFERKCLRPSTGNVLAISATRDSMANQAAHVFSYDCHTSKLIDP